MSAVESTSVAAPPRRRINLGFDRFSGLYLWAVFIIVFGVWDASEFLTISTVHGIASTEAVTGMVALAVLIPLAGGLYDLSVGATANLTGLIVIVQMNNHGWAVVPAIALALAVGVAIGLVNSFVVVRLGVNSFIATLGMSSILSAVLIIVTGDGVPLPPLSTAWNNLTQTTVLGFQLVVIYLLVLALVLWWLLAHTPAGRYLYAIGGNPEAARLSGVRVKRYSTAALVMSSSIAGVAGVLFTSQNGPSLDFGAALLLPAFAAAFLGSTQLLPGKFNVWGTLLAIFVLATGVYGLELVSGAPWLSDMFNGVALIVAVALSINRGGSTTRWLRPRRTTNAVVAAAESDPGQVGDADHGPESSLEDPHAGGAEDRAAEKATDTM
jgi:ribose transport system permease protein